MNARFIGILVLFAGIGLGEVPPRYFVVTLQHGVNSETMFIRYVLDSQFGGWVEPRYGVSSYLIDTNQHDRQAARIKAVLYSPGCAIRTLDLPTYGSQSQPYSFVCQPLPAISITGTLSQAAGLAGREIKVKYVARWAQQFLGLGDGLAAEIPLGSAKYRFADGSFRLSLPDLSKDPLAQTPDSSGELQIFATDRATGKVVAQLVPTDRNLRTRMGNLRIQKEYPSRVVFEPCVVHDFQAHDANGFAIRGNPSEACAGSSR